MRTCTFCSMILTRFHQQSRVKNPDTSQILQTCMFVYEILFRWNIQNSINILTTKVVNKIFMIANTNTHTPPCSKPNIRSSVYPWILKRANTNGKRKANNGYSITLQQQQKKHGFLQIEHNNKPFSYNFKKPRICNKMSSFVLHLHRSERNRQKTPLKGARYDAEWNLHSVCV